MKQCEAPGCTFNAFSHKYCSQHQYLRTDEKWKLAEAKRLGKKNGFLVNKLGETTYFTRSTIKPKPKEATGEAELFEELWSIRKHVSWLTGASLRQYEVKMDDEQCWHKHPLWHNLFHHVLNKKNYSRFRLLHDNIIFLTPQEHVDIHSLSRDKLERKYGLNHITEYFNLVESLKEKYNFVEKTS